MWKWFVAPDDSGFIVLPDGDDSWGQAPEGWVEVDQAEYEQRLAAQRQVAEQRSAEFLQQARSAQREAGQALVGLGLTIEQAAVLSGVPAAELEADRST